MEAIETINLTNSYSNIQAVDKLNFTVKEGELVSLLGMNGAGKSTTIKMLSTLVLPTSGDAKVYGHSICHDSFEIKKIMNVSPQETAIAPNLNVEENLRFICGVYGYSKKEAIQKTKQMIEDYTMQTIAHQKASTLSGGWQRRLSIAMALITEPKMLFLDEPTLGLDVLSRHELWNIIRKLKQKMSVILTTHYLEEAEELSDRIIIMSNGKRIVDGTIEEIKQKANATTLENAFLYFNQKGDTL